MFHNFTSPLFVALAVTVAMPAQAREHEVAAPSGQAQIVTLAEWNARVQQELGRQIVYPDAVMGEMSGTGVVRVKFHCSEQGRPDKVELLKSSGSRMLDNAALRAVKRVAALHPLPAGISHEQNFEAVIAFVEDPRDQRVVVISQEQAKRNAWYHELAQAAPKNAVAAR